MGAPAPALNLWPGLVDQGMADLVQSVTEEMVGQNKHLRVSPGWVPIAWPLGVGCRVLRWLGALRPQSCWLWIWKEMTDSEVSFCFSLECADHSLTLS